VRPGEQRLCWRFCRQAHALRGWQADSGGAGAVTPLGRSACGRNRPGCPESEPGAAGESPRLLRADFPGSSPLGFCADLSSPLLTTNHEGALAFTYPNVLDKVCGVSGYRVLMALNRGRKSVPVPPHRWMNVEASIYDNAGNKDYVSQTEMIFHNPPVAILWFSLGGLRAAHRTESSLPRRSKGWASARHLTVEHGVTIKIGGRDA
jgi:hypothetical protein